MLNTVTVDSFQAEVNEALKAYDRHVVCIDKTPDQLEQGLKSLLDKAVRAYINRAPGLRHGIALDKQVTVILSQTDGERPLCGIYFNLSSPYRKQQQAKSAQARVAETRR